MSKLKKNKSVPKSHLSLEEKKLGKNHVYILVGMIVIGLVAGLYYMQ